jgi:Tfp pilus assembly protein PilN
MPAPQIDFLPAAHRERRSRQKLWMFRGLMLLMLAGGMTWASLSVSHRSSRLFQQLRLVEHEREEARSRIAQVEQLSHQKEELSRRLGVLKDVLARARGALVFEAVGRSCAENTHLTHVSLRTDTTGTAPQVALTIEGRCPDHIDVANLQTRLAAEPVLSDVSVVLSEKVAADDGRIKFVMTARSPGLISPQLVSAVR